MKILLVQAAGRLPATRLSLTGATYIFAFRSRLMEGILYALATKQKGPQ